nr:MAG TPA: hypothetical protein [Caudoviricetes sp.]
MNKCPRCALYKGGHCTLPWPAEPGCSWCDIPLELI